MLITKCAISSIISFTFSYAGGKIFHNEMSLRSYNHSSSGASSAINQSSSSGVSSANSTDLVTSSSSAGNVTSSDSNVTSSDSNVTSQDPANTAAARCPLDTKDSDLRSPPPVLRSEFSFSEVKCQEAVKDGNARSATPPATPTPESRVEQLERLLEQERVKVKERDRQIAELEQKLMKYQLEELKQVM